ncbi:MAG: hypothetical protein JWL88_260 [Parcubacteria group bacterium]|nr:hypothetical protein [Parcubacteria group bacterium]
MPVFRTFVPNGSGDMVIFCTTNEKVHLLLGKLSDQAHRKLAKLFRNETDCGDELTFTYDSGSPETQPRGSLFVTASKNADGATVFHLAPGH